MTLLQKMIRPATVGITALVLTCGCGKWCARSAPPSSSALSQKAGSSCTVQFQISDAVSVPVHKFDQKGSVVALTGTLVRADGEGILIRDSDGTELWIPNRAISLIAFARP
jgi:hypothetical protein